MRICCEREITAHTSKPGRVLPERGCAPRGDGDWALELALERNRSGARGRVLRDGRGDSQVGRDEPCSDPGTSHRLQRDLTRDGGPGSRSLQARRGVSGEVVNCYLVEDGRPIAGRLGWGRGRIAVLTTKRRATWDKRSGPPPSRTDPLASWDPMTLCSAV